MFLLKKTDTGDFNTPSLYVCSIFIMIACQMHDLKLKFFNQGQHAAHTRLLSYPSWKQFSNKKTFHIRAGTGFALTDVPEPPGKER